MRTPALPWCPRPANHGVVFLLVTTLSVFGMCSANDYMWKTDDWSTCNHDNCGEGGTQLRNVWCVHLAGWTTLDDNCPVAEKPSDHRPCFRVCQYHRFQYSWRVGDWSTCRPQRGEPECQGKYGTQSRNVTCMSNCGGDSDVPTDDVCEHFETRPQQRRPCKLTCPDDCIVSDFGPWSECNSCWVRMRTRYRTVLAAPHNGGRECAPLYEREDCVLPKFCYEEIASFLQYKVGKWSDCTAFPRNEIAADTFTRAVGNRRRTVDCIDHSGKVVNESQCAHITQPVAIRLCARPRNCLVSTWSNWTLFGRHGYPLTSSKTLLRRRNVLQVTRGDGSGSGCPASLTDKRNLALEDLQQKCTRYRWLSSSWGTCTAYLVGDVCGIGIQRRLVLCVRAEGGTVPVANSNCVRAAPHPARSCTVPCPEDCLLSAWSAWSICLPERCSKSRISTDQGYRTRSRYVLREGRHGGVPCPHLVESQPCVYPPCYRWKVKATETCVLDYQCGQGVRSRKLVCVDTLGAEVETEHCHQPKPSSREACHVACSHDCVTSAWSAWSTCSRSCGLGRMAGYQTRRKRIIAAASQDGAACPRSHMLTDTRRCASVACHSYYWSPHAWGRCRSRSKDSCGPGLQHRKLACLNTAGAKVSNKRCRSELAPETSRECTVTCQTDCLVSDFTDWSACPVTCYTPGSQNTHQQTRWRFLLVSPSHRGLSCPDLFESRACTGIPQCVDYRWDVSQWGKCTFAKNSSVCGDGFRVRDVNCASDTENDGPLPAEFCVSQLGYMPADCEPCRVKCGQEDCIFSDWSPWSSCGQRCGGIRTRVRYIEGTSAEKQYCHDKLIFPTVEKTLCVCASHTAEPIGDWSDCIIEDKRSSQPMTSLAQLVPEHGYCGIGTRFQTIVCVGGSSGNSSAAICHPASDFLREMCFLPCPQDCELSDWSQWSECGTTSPCGSGERTRSRYRVKSALDGGRPCPPLVDDEEYQKEPCHLPCDHTQWRVSKWSVCSAVKTLTTANRCGQGFQSRTVKCARLVNGVWTDSAKDACEMNKEPSKMRYCHVPCPGHCVVSEWAKWSTCMACDPSTTRTRMRTILRQPATTSGVLQCAHLEENERCEPGVNCRSVSWQWSTWGDCILPKGVPCGDGGNRTRVRQCTRLDGTPTAERDCIQADSTPSTDVTVKACSVECAVDCALSDWNQWTSCDVTCGLGYRSRSRHVVIQARHGGRPCSKTLHQTTPCPYVECFEWQTTEWSGCQLQAAVCGYGTETRKAKCVRHDGIEMDSGLCAEDQLGMISLERECLLPCPGDCLLSSWSEWSPCHRPCDTTVAIEGKQTRSRAILSEPRAGGEPCPQTLWQERACYHGYCPTYSWHADYWFGNQRAIWCLRSDGVPVIGGCDESSRPALLKRCEPSCDRIAHAYCQDTNLCGCKREHRAVIRDGALSACLPIMHGANHTITTPEADADNAALFFPRDGSINFWMYAVIAAGVAFVLFVSIAIYMVCVNTRKEDRPSHRPSHSASISTATTRQRDSMPLMTSPLARNDATTAATIVAIEST